MSNGNVAGVTEELNFILFLNIIKVAHAAVGSCDGLCGFKGLTKEYWATLCGDNLDGILSIFLVNLRNFNMGIFLKN